MSRTKLSLIAVTATLLGAALWLVDVGEDVASSPVPSHGAGAREAQLPAAGFSDPAATRVSDAPAAVASAASFAAIPGIRLVDGRVAAHLHGASLPAVLEAVARGGHVELEGEQALAGLVVSIDFDALPVAEALLRLSEGHDSAFIYGTAERGAARLVKLSIRSGGAGITDASAPGLDAQLQQLDDADPQQRADAIETIAGRAGEQARPALLRALGDADEDVRLRALEQTQLVPGLAMPAEVLRTMVQQDVSENVRFKVLDVAATDPRIDAATLAAISRLAEADASELVRGKAVEIRQQLESAPRMARD